MDRARIDQVTREDMFLFINACFTSTGQAEYETDARSQALSLDFLHEYVCVSYRRLYARTLAAGINHHNVSRIVVNLLATGRSTPPDFKAEEGALIAAALRHLPTHRALATFCALRERGVNNRRSRAIVRDWFAARRDLPRDLVKYRSRIRTTVRHTHVALPGEAGPFLSRGWKARVYETPLLEAFRGAHYGRSSLYQLPYSVAEGLARRFGIPRDTFLEGIAPQMTLHEKARLQEAAARAGADLGMDLGRMPLTRLALYLLSLGEEERRARASELRAAFARAAGLVIARAPFSLGRVAAVLDRSRSSWGSMEKRRRPLAVALGVSALLRRASRVYRAFWTVPTDDDLLVTPLGQTDLATPLLDALEWGAEVLVIVSDGAENCPPGGVSEVVRVFRERLDPHHRVSLLHLNPVFDAEAWVLQGVCPLVPTLGLRDAEDLPSVLGFGRFAEGTSDLASLEAFLAHRVAELLGTPASPREEAP